MAQFKIKIRTDLDKPLNQYTFGGKMFTQDNKANRIDVSVYEKGQFVPIEGSIMAVVMRNDGTTVAFSGGIEEGVPYVELPEAAYAVEGPISILIRLINGEQRTVIGICNAYVTKTADAQQVTAGSVVTNIDELIEKAETLEEFVSYMSELDITTLANIEEYIDRVETAQTELSTALNRASSAWDAKVNKPEVNPDGTDGQLLRTNGDGTTTWVDVGLPTNQQTTDAVEAWLTEHAAPSGYLMAVINHTLMFLEPNEEEPEEEP